MYLIFDFDGTLVDSFSCVVEKFNSMANDFNVSKISREDMAELRHLSSTDLIKYLKVPLYKIPYALHLARKHLKQEMHKLTPFAGIPQLLHNLDEAGFQLGIVTSNSKENVISWLESHQIKHYFNFIHVELGYFGKGRILKKVRQVHKTGNSMYIGDETRDIVAAKQCNMASLAVTWGFNSEKILAQYNPHYIARRPEDILAIGLKHLEI